MRSRTKPFTKLAVSPNEAAVALGVDRSKIAEAIRSGALPCYTGGLLGIKRRVLVLDLLRLVRRQQRI
jgi:hypothetical protein